MPGQAKMPESVRNFLNKRMIGKEIKGMLIKKVLGVGNTAITYKVEDEYGSAWALKLVTKESYGERSPFIEVSRFARVEDERFLVFPIEADDYSLKINRKQHDFIWFKSRCVKGQSLKEFLSTESIFSAKSEILKYMENLAVALEALHSAGFSHGDLHDRNIMREIIGKNGILPETRYVIIDFSEAHQIGQTQAGLSKDIENYGKHLRSFSDLLYRRKTLSRNDEIILSSISHIPGMINGTSTESAGIHKPSEALKRLKDALSTLEEGSPRKLRTPFDSLSAENIANDALLADLCFTEMWWTPELEKNKNILLVGPRGCGKTMIFRRLRFKTKVAAAKIKEIKSDPYIGFYIPCESIFYMRFSDLSEVDAEENKDALILFFNMAILSEVCSTISILPDFLGPIPKSLADSIVNLFKKEIGALWDELAFSLEILNLEDISLYSESIMRYIRNAIAWGKQIPSKGTSDFTIKLVQLIKSEISNLAGKYFIFFLDDYTEERVPLILQDALHPIVCFRSKDLCFKISAHMFGSIYCNPSPLARDEGRNINIINLGTAYLDLSKRAQGSNLLLQILNERFINCDGYEGSIKDWLGKTSYPGGKTISWALHDPNSRQEFNYHGVECLKNLCTGDYSEMIRMVGEIFEEAGIKDGSKVIKIEPYKQSKAIINVSREYLGRIRHIRPDGEKLYDIVKSFGKLSKNLLYSKEPVGQGTDHKGFPRKDPYDLLSIFVDDLNKTIKKFRDTWERLQKASVFIDIGVAPSQRSIIADRVTLRRIYCPAFSTTLTSSEHLQLTKKQFEGFIDEPQEFCGNYFQRVTRNGDITTLSLFMEETEYQIEDFHEKDEYTGLSMPKNKDKLDFLKISPFEWIEVINLLPDISPIDDILKKDQKYDIFIGAMGFEERTTSAIQALSNISIFVKNAVLLEFDRHYKATEQRRDKYEKLIKILTKGISHRPLNSPVSVSDPYFPERLNDLLQALSTSKKTPRIIFDCTSCPSIIHSQTLAVLFKMRCKLTILYSEAKEYFPTEKEWKSGKVKPKGKNFSGPFEGFRFVSYPTILQADDPGERPVMLILFPTFNTERTDGVLIHVEPTDRIWIFGEPHDLKKNEYRIKMAQSFASPIFYPNDKWSSVNTFNYKDTLATLGGIYFDSRFRYRIVIMPHGSKMQTLGVNLFAQTHQISLIFAMPKSYNPDRYSKGCKQVWAIEFDDTEYLISRIRKRRVIGR